MLKRSIHASSHEFEKERDRQHNKVTKEIPRFTGGNIVLLINHKTHTPWATICMSNFCICKVINDGACDMQDPSGHICQASIVYVHLLMSAE